MIGRRRFLLGSAAMAGVLALPAHAAPQVTPVSGGRGGRIIRVTTLAPEGPGSFTEAVKAKGPRIVVFEVGGVVDLAMKPVKISNGDLTIAGQTAPSLVTFIKGGIEIGQGARNVVIQHIAVRPGEAGQAKTSGWECDGIYAYGASQIEVSNCSITWATDEGLSASGKRFGEDNAGADVEAWRAYTSNNIRFAKNIVAEGLSNSTHSKGEHSKGSLLHDNATGILIYRNVYAHNYERSPLLKGGVHAAVVNNLIFNPGAQAIHYNLMDLEWGDQPHQLGELSAVGNVLRAGFSTREDIAFLTIGGVGDLRYHGRDNLAVDRQGRPLPMFGRYTTSPARIIESDRAHIWPDGLDVLPASQVETHVLRFAGARPWDRDEHDIRVIFDVVEGRGHIIDDESEVGGYPVVEPARAPFVEAEWDLDTMEPRSGRYPGQRDDFIQQPTTARDVEMRR